jgi:hypothetical protein
MREKTAVSSSDRPIRNNFNSIQLREQRHFEEFGGECERKVKNAAREA